MANVIFIYATFPNEVLATKMANELLNDHLIACANIYPVKSVYRWEGKTQKSEESVAIFKTVKERYDLIEERIRAQHQYKCPCIVAYPVATGYLPFLEWVGNETKK